jgi:hypothetical protein
LHFLWHPISESTTFCSARIKRSKELNINTMPLSSFEQLQKKKKNQAQKDYNHQTAGMRILRHKEKETENDIK